MINNIRNNTIIEIDAKKDLNALNKIKNVETIKYKKRTPGHKKLIKLFDDLFDIILTDKILESKSQENEKVESRKEENDETLMPLKDEKNVKNKKTSTNTKKATDKKKDEDKDILLEYREDIDDKLSKKYSHRKEFNSFINEFDLATNKEDKEKIVKELKEIDDIVGHYAEMEDDSNEYKYKFFNIINTIDYFLYEYSKKWASDFNWREAVKDY